VAPTGKIAIVWGVNGQFILRGGWGAKPSGVCRKGELPEMFFKSGGKDWDPKPQKRRPFGKNRGPNHRGGGDQARPKKGGHDSRANQGGGTGPGKV